MYANIAEKMKNNCGWGGKEDEYLTY